jgi:acetamidase/formamidase
MKEHSLSATPTHSVWNRVLPPRLRIDPGDTVHIECQDSSGAQVHALMNLAEYLQIDRTRIHALTGPIYIHGAEPGDVLQIEVREIAHKGWGWTSIVEGLGFLKQRFKSPYLFIWELAGDTSKSLAPATVPLRPFCGVMGVARAEDGEFRTRPPGAFGGNMDVRELCAGATLYLPVFNPGALFSTGDAHAAQGDGEVCINGIECPVDVTLRFHLHKQRHLPGPVIESAPRRTQDNETGWIVVESDKDPTAAAQAATSRMIDILVDRWGFTDVHAYLLCSVALHLKLSQVVNEPMFTVSATIPRQVLPHRTLF